MQVVAFATPTCPDWRWRLVNYAGDVVEESSQTFPSIATAITHGTRRMNDLAEDDSRRAPTYYRSTSQRRSR